MNRSLGSSFTWRANEVQSDKRLERIGVRHAGHFVGILMGRYTWRGELPDDLVELENAAWPAMRQQDGDGVGI